MLKFGIVGAAIGSFIADVHIRGIEMTHKAALVCGCFSRNEEKNLAAGKARGIAEDRIYKDAYEMAEKEAAREDGIDFVVITTPNVYHYDIIKAFLSAGINVSSDKPVTIYEDQALELQALAKEKGLKFCVTFTYSGYPILRHAREIIRRGDIGDVTMVMGEYVQDWMAGNNGIAPWRVEPEFTGRMNAISDIGSHIEFAVNFITGREIAEVCTVFDNAGYQTDLTSSILMKYDNGATGIYWVTQLGHGNDNGSHIRIYGTKGSIEWRNEDPERFTLTKLGEPTMVISKGRTYNEEYPYSSAGRLPAGHHEGWYSVFANIYDAFLDDLLGKEHGFYPTIEDGVRVMHWLEKCYESNQKHAWVKL